MPVAAGPPYPSLSYYTADRPAQYGFVSRYMDEVRRDVDADLRAERARRLNSQRSYHTYPSAYYSSRYPRPHYVSRAYERIPRHRASTTRPRFDCPSPLVPPYPAGPDPGYSTRRVRSPPRNYSTMPEAAPQRQVRFQSPQSFYRYTPAPSFPTTTTATSATPTPMRMPEPQPYPINYLAPMNTTPRYTPHQNQAPVMPFPDSRHAKPLPPTPPSSSSTPFGSSAASIYGSPYYSSSGSYETSGSSRSSRTRPQRKYHVTPSIFGSSALSTYGDTSSGDSSVFNPPQMGKDRTISLRKASERMADFKRVADTWMTIVKKQRREKLTKDETDAVSLVKDLVQRAHTALETIDVILASLTAYEGIGHGSPFSTEKLKADTSALARIGMSLHQRLAGLTKRLKNAEATAEQTRPPNSPDGCAAAMNFPGCIKSLFCFTSLSKTRRERYSELDPEKTMQFQPYAPPGSALIGALYADVQRTYNTAAAALAGFESSLRTFQLDLQTQGNQRYFPMTIG